MGRGGRLVLGLGCRSRVVDGLGRGGARVVIGIGCIVLVRWVSLRCSRLVRVSVYLVLRCVRL